MEVVITVADGRFTGTTGEATGTDGMVTLGGSGFRQLCQCLTTADGKACQWVNPFSQLKSSREAEHQESTLRRKQTQI